MTVTHAKPAPQAAPVARESGNTKVDADSHIASAPAVDLGRVSASTGEPSTQLIDGTLLVDGTPAGGQLTKSEFFAQLREQVIATAANELAGTDWSVDNCPWLDYWFAYYEHRSARDAEAALLRYAPGARDATDANGYFAPAVERVRAAIQRWRETGEVDAPPIAMAPAEATMMSLGPGRPLDASTRSRFEGAMGTDLSATRIHTDEIGARAAAGENARAFAIGSHVAFADGEYKPNTLEGDALLAHELAHTSQQAGARSSGQDRHEGSERDADGATIGIMGRLLGLLTPERPRPSRRTGLSLQRCLEHKSPDEKETYKDKGPDETYLEATPSLIERNGEKSAIVGQTVRFRPRSRIQGIEPNAVVWRAFLMLDENGNESDHEAKKPKWDTGYPVGFDRAGLWFVGMEVRTAKHFFSLWREVRVFDPKKLATDLSAGLKPGDYSVFRFNIAYRGLADYGVEKDQSVTAPRDAQDKPHSYIKSSAPSNPMEVRDKPVTFTVVPHPDAATFQWYQWFNNPERHPRSWMSGKDINILGTRKSTSIDLDRADEYTITCHQFDATGKELPVAMYRQSVLLGNEWKQAKKWLSYVEKMDKYVDEIDPTTRKQVPGVYVSKVTGESMPMAVWVGTKKGNPKSFILLDLMFGRGPHKETGSSLASAFGEYADWAEDEYPAGSIHLVGSAVGDKDRDITTDGETTAESIAHTLGLGSVGLTVIGMALLIFPPTDAAGWAVLGYTATGAAAAMGAASSGFSLYNRMQKGETDALGYAIDILGLAASALQATAAFKTAVGIARTGATAEQLIVSSAGRKFVAWTETGLVTASGVLISAEAIIALGALSDSNLSEGEKADRLASLLFQIIAQAGMMAMQGKNLAAVRAAVNTRNLATLELQVLGQLDKTAIDGLKRIPDTELSRVAMLVLDDPHAASLALSKKTAASADELARDMHAPTTAPTPSTPDIPTTTTTTTPDVPTTPTPDVPTTPTPDVPTTPAPDVPVKPTPAPDAPPKKPTPAKPAKVKPPKPGEPGFQPRTPSEALAMGMGMGAAPDGYHWRTIKADGKDVPILARSGRRGGNTRPKLRWNPTLKGGAGDFETISDQWDRFLYSEFGGKKPVCFPPETIVRTPDGDRRIDELSIGDTVYSFDENQTKVVPSTITAVHRNWTRRLATVHTADTSIVATRMHPFWVEGERGWLSLRSLWSGMQLRAVDGRLLDVDRVVVEDRVSSTFNLEIDRTHSFFVGAHGVLVHNGPTPESAWAIQVPELEQIYRVVETRVVNGQAVDVVIYVGQTNQTLEARFKEHLAKKPDWQAKAASDRLRIELETKGNWTPFETAVWEKHTIEKYKRINPELENIANPISEQSFNKFHDLHNPCQ